MPHSLTSKCAAELIGTFVLVLTIGCSVIGGVAMAPLAIGAALMVMVYANGHISGAHFNPAVTLALCIRGRCSSREFIPYIIAQVAGALLATLAVKALVGSPAQAASALTVKKALLAEFLFTFALAYVVLNVATAKATSGNSFYGLAIGMTVMAGAFTVGSISGGAFNPAVALAATVMGLAPTDSLWIYLAANFGGGAMAAFAFKFINPEDK